MARKAKNFEIIAMEKEVAGQAVTEYFLKKTSLGLVRPVAANKFAAELPDGATTVVKTNDEAVDVLIRHYHLHH